MCMIESKVYVSSSGSEWEQEITHLCTRASAGRVCNKIEHKTTHAGMISRRESQRRTLGHGDTQGARDSQAYSSRRQERKIVVDQSRYVVEPDSSGSSDSGAPRTVYPAAPSPPSHHRHNRSRSSEQEQPMMTGCLESDAGARPPSPSYDFITDKARLTQDRRPPSLPRIPLEGDMDGYSSRDSRRKVSVEIPAHNEYATPRLQAPPLRRKSIRVEHKRNDSARVLLPSSREQSADREARHQAAEERAQRHQQQSRERYEAHMGAAHRRQEAADDARLRREEQEMERQADQERLLDSLRDERYPPSLPSRPLQRRDSQPSNRRPSERQRQTEAAARSAWKAGERVQRSEREERTREKRLESERRAAARERRESNARQRDRELVVQRREDGVVGPAAYTPQRVVRAPPVIHYPDVVAEQLSSDNPRARGAETIAVEQARLAREELAATMHDLALDDPFARDFDTGGQLNSDFARGERRRTLRDDQRRRLDM